MQIAIVRIISLLLIIAGILVIYRGFRKTSKSQEKLNPVFTEPTDLINPAAYILPWFAKMLPDWLWGIGITGFGIYLLFDTWRQ